MATNELGFELGELAKDEKLIQNINNFREGLKIINEQLDEALELRRTPNLNLDDRIKLDCYLSYIVNTLFWLELKIQGRDSKEHPIVNELTRTRTAIADDKAIDEAFVAPRLDVKAAKRFIQHGMHTRFDDNGDVSTTEKPTTKN